MFLERFVQAQDVSALEVGQAYFELHHRLHRLVDRRMSSDGLSLARCKVLLRLSEQGPINQATLAGLLGFAPRSVTDVVDALEREGLVTRTEDRADRRARILDLTPAGRDALAVAQVSRSQVMDDIFGSLTSRQRADLVALFETIRTNLPTGDTSCGD